MCVHVYTTAIQVNEAAAELHNLKMHRLKYDQHKVYEL